MVNCVGSAIDPGSSGGPASKRGGTCSVYINALQQSRIDMTGMSYLAMCGFCAVVVQQLIVGTRGVTIILIYDGGKHPSVRQYREITRYYLNLDKRYTILIKHSCESGQKRCINICESKRDAVCDRNCGAGINSTFVDT